MPGVTHASPARVALFDRLGGFDALDQAVTATFSRAAADPALATLPPAVRGGDAAWQMQMFLTRLTGGPMEYDGPDPAVEAARLGLGASQVEALIGHLAAAVAEGGVAPDVVAELRDMLRREAAARGLSAMVAPPPTAGQVPPTDEALVALATAEAARLGLTDWNLFVLDPRLTLVYLDRAATAAVRTVDGELRRAFNLGAQELLGHPILRIHPAPTRFSALLLDHGRLPRDTTWCFGRAVWKAKPFAVSHEGRIIGYGISWRDFSEQQRNETVFQRLRMQAEDLPLPVMFPDATLERWYGNAACEASLARLAPYLPEPVNPDDGIPLHLFFPDAADRRALFADPGRLPHKVQLRFGPETVAVLVSPIRDQDQRYLGPQITWEIVYRAEPPSSLPPPPERSGPVEPPTPAPAPAVVGSAVVLRQEAQALQMVSTDLLTLTRLLNAVADEAEQAGAAQPEPTVEDPARPEALRRADEAVREALRAVRVAAAEAAAATAIEAQGLCGEFGARLTDAVGRAQASAETMRRIRALAEGLSDLRSAPMAEPPRPRPTTPGP